MDDGAVYVGDTDLRNIQLLNGVDLKSIKGLLDICQVRMLQKHEVLITRTDSNRTVYLLLKGRLCVHLDSPDGEPHIILGPGESVGEMSVVDQKPASAFVVADEECTLLAMNEEILWSLVQSSHIAACNLLYILVQRLRYADSVISTDIELRHQYQQYGSIDALTGLHNRYWFNNMIKRQCLRSSISKNPFSIIMIDIDNFKEFNDKYGHLYGDNIIYSVAHTLNDLLRPTEVIARYGGDEFIVLLPELNITMARHIAERLHNGLMDKVPVMPDGQDILHPTISIGIAELKPGQTPEMLIDAADKALYRAKNSGRNRISD